MTPDAPPKPETQNHVHHCWYVEEGFQGLGTFLHEAGVVWYRVWCCWCSKEHIQPGCPHELESHGPYKDRQGWT